MNKKIVIVESPNKIKSIEKYLGNDYVVKASVGHIVYLPSSGEERFGVDIDTWTPNYKIDPKKKKVVTELKETIKNSKEIFIATDPDREGEAIADNLVEFLKLKNYKRIRFNEITKDAILLAINNPSTVDENLVKSQVARRILDRIIGFKLSTLMKIKIHNSPTNPSAGRVQSIALKLVVEKEQEIEKFIPIEYVTVQAKVGEDLFADLISGNYKGNNKWIDPINKEKVTEELNGTLIVTNIKISQRKDPKLTPLKQSTLYKKANSKLGMSSSGVQSIAQRLYEGYGEGGLISYPRTDSTRYSSTFIKKANSFISKELGSQYLTQDIKGSAGSQDAHEAIRPTDLYLTPQKVTTMFNLSPQEQKVYELIYNHTLQTLMKEPIREILRYELKEGSQLFSLSSSKVIFDGYLKIIGYSVSKELPKLKEGDELNVIKYLIEDKETKPPARYNDGSLIEKLDNIKVGRPSTFATTIKILRDREYTEKDGKAIKPTEFGRLVLSKLLEAFPDIINEPYTAKMELQLDEIADGKFNHKQLLDEFWGKFKKKVQSATQELSITKLSNIPAGKDCPECKEELIVRTNKKWKTKFFACSGFPNCKYTESDPNAKKPFFRKKWKK